MKTDQSRHARHDKGVGFCQGVAESTVHWRLQTRAAHKLKERDRTNTILQRFEAKCALLLKMNSTAKTLVKSAGPRPT